MKKKYFPLIVTELYLAFSLVLFRFGVWNFQLPSKKYFYSYIIAFHVAFVLGYIISINKGRGKYLSLKTPFNLKNITPLLFINIFMAFFNSVRMSNLGSISFSSIFSRFVQQISTPSAGYYEKFAVDSSNVFGGQLGTIILTIWGVLSPAIIPLGFYFWAELKKSQKWLFIFNVFITISGSLLTGTNKKIFDIIIAFAVYLWLNTKDSSRRKGYAKRTLFFILIFVVGIAIFGYFIGNREFGSFWYKSVYRLGGVVPLNKNSIFFKLVPVSFYGILASITTYLCQGYYGFALTYGISLPPMFGKGSSLYIVDKLDLNEHTYQYAVQRFGWDSRIQWDSIYTWIANDVGKIGTIFVMFLLGCFFAVLYKECKQNKNPVSFVLMNYMITTLLFIPCNFQILQDVSGVESLITFLVLWMIMKFSSRKGYKIERQVA